MMERGDDPAAGRNDLALVVAAQAGDADAYVLLVERHAPRLLGLARRLLGNEQDAEDAVQEAFLRAHRALVGFRGESGFGTWLYRIALNACRDLGRAHARIDEERLVRETEERFLDADYTVDPERVALALERREELDAAFARIPPVYREAVLLHDQEGFTMAEVAVLTGVPLPTAKSRLRRGRMLLVDALAGRPEPGRARREEIGRAHV